LGDHACLGQSKAAATSSIAAALSVNPICLLL
jgi:hypothetical protein